MAAPAAVLSVLVRANTSQATSALARFNTQVGATQAKSSKMTSALKTVGKVGGVGVAVGLGFAVKKAADFESQMSSLESVTNSNARQMRRFKKQALDAGAATKFSALDAAKAQTELAKGGLSVSQIMKGGLKSSLALAAAGEMELADAAETTANAIKLFGLEGKDTMKVADALATAANATTADVTDFAMALKQGGGVAKMAGLSFTETVLALEALAETGVRNSDAGTSMKTAFIQLLKPSKKQAELAKELGLNFVSASGGMKSMSAISAMLRSKLGGMTKAQRTAALATIAGTDGVRTLNALYAAGPDKLNKMKAGLDKSGTAAAVAAKKQDNLKGKVENLMGSIETLAIIVGSTLIPPLTDATVAVTKFLNSLSTGKGPTGELMGTLRSLSDSLGLSKRDWGQFGQAVSNAWNFASGVIRRVAPGILQMVRGWAQMVGGALKIITGILTLDFRLAWDGVKQIFSGALNTILGVLRASTAPFRELVVRLASVIKGPFVAAWNVVKAGASVGLRALVTLVRTFTAPQRAAMGALVAALKGPFAAAWGAMRTVARGALAAILNLLRTFTAPHRAAARVLGAAIRTPIAAGFNAAKAVAGTVLRAIVAVVRAMAGPWRAAAAVLGAAIRGPVSAAVRALRVAVSGAMSAIRSTFATGSKGVLTVMAGMGGGISAVASAIRNVFAALGRVVKRIVDFITKAIDKLVSAVGKAKDKVGELSPSLPSLPSIPGIPGVKFQRGGLIPGAGPGDKVPVLAEPGEGFINKKAVQAMGGPKAVNAINTAYPRFQGGGIVGLGRQLQKQGFQVGEHPAFGGVGGSHVQGSHHYAGRALDVNADSAKGGEMAALDRLYKRLKGMKGIVELLWRVPNHFDHLHVAMAGGGGKLGDVGAGGISDIPGFKVRGQGSVADIARGAADKMRTVANSYLGRIAPAEGSEGRVAGVGPGKGVASRAQMVKWARKALQQTRIFPATPENIGKILTLAQKESGWKVDSINLWDSNAKAGNPSGGLMHITKDKVGGSMKRLFDPVDNIATSIRYQKSQYGNLVTHSPYARGGIVETLQKGAVAGAGSGFPSSKEIQRQEKRITKFQSALGKKGIKAKQQKKLNADLGRARSVLGTLKARRKKGLGGRKKAGAKLTSQVAGFKMPLNVTKGIEAGSAHIQDLNDLYDQFEQDYRSTVVTDAEGNEVELDQTELNDLVARKTQIRNLIGGDPIGSGGQIAHLRDKVIPMVQERIAGVTEFMDRMKKRVEKNMKKLRDYLDRAAKLRKSITTIDRTVAQIRKKKKLTDGDKKKLSNLAGKREKYGNTLNLITQRRIPALEADNALITGDKRPKQPLDVAKMSAGEGLLPDAFAVLGSTDSTTGGEGGIDLRGFMAEFQDKLRPGGLQAEWKGHDITIKALLKEGAEKPKAVAETGDTELAGLLRQQLQQANLRTAVSEAQFKVLRDAPPFGGSFAGGGIVPGPAGSPRTIIAHGGETVSSGGDVNVNLHFAPGTEWLRDFVQVEVERGTRQQARAGARVLPGRGGGT